MDLCKLTAPHLSHLQILAFYIELWCDIFKIQIEGAGQQLWMATQIFTLEGDLSTSPKPIYSFFNRH